MFFECAPHKSRWIGALCAQQIEKFLRRDEDVVELDVWWRTRWIASVSGVSALRFARGSGQGNYPCH